LSIKRGLPAPPRFVALDRERFTDLGVSCAEHVDEFGAGGVAAMGTKPNRRRAVRAAVRDAGRGHRVPPAVEAAAERITRRRQPQLAVGGALGPRPRDVLDLEDLPGLLVPEAQRVDAVLAGEVARRCEAVGEHVGCRDSGERFSGQRPFAAEDRADLRDRRRAQAL